MSPTATIAAVVVALVFFGWLFQTDVKDPAYEEYMKRQALEKKVDVKPIPIPLGINVTDAGVTTGNTGDLSMSRLPTSNYTASSGAVPAGFEVDAAALPPFGDSPRPQIPTGSFTNNVRLSGTFVGVATIDEIPQASAPGEEPQITFRRDGTFTTQNMSLAEVEMEAPTAAGTTISDKGTGRYRLSATSLELQYTDGWSRKKGNKRTFVVAPVSGPEGAPVLLTIQGKLFKLDPYR